MWYRTACSSGFRCRTSPSRFLQYRPVASKLATKHAAGHGQCLNVPCIHLREEATRKLAQFTK
jgi:hypothetical protein